MHDRHEQRQGRFVPLLVSNFPNLQFSRPYWQTACMGMYYPRHGTFARWCAAKSTSIQVQHSPVLVDIAEGMGHLFRALILILLRALTDARFFNTSVFFFHLAIDPGTQAPKHPSSPVSSEENQSSPFSPTWRAGMLLSLSPFGPRPITHHILPLLPPARPSMVGQRTPTINRCQPEADNHQV